MIEPDTHESFGNWLQRRRRGLGLTQTDLAQQLGCAPITLRKIEAEERRPSLAIAQRMAECLRVPEQQQNIFVRFARGELRAGAQLDNEAMPPLPALHSFPNLPQPPYPIIGREEILARATDFILVKHKRLLSLIGPPGVGKTRLALALAHALHQHFAHGAAFVELAPVQHASLVPAALAEALHIEDSNAANTTLALQAALRNRQQVLVLDNFEHVLDAAPFVAELVAACPGLSCLITSRERLRVRAEHLLDVPVLGLPQTTTTPTLMEIESAAASQLFVARAQQANPHLNIIETDAAPIAALCAKLDGLPLALELLAARADILTPTQLHDDLTRGLNAFGEGEGYSLRDLPERHRTLRNAIRWSVRLLSSTQATLFAYLAVFAGGFDGAAAQAVCAHDPDDLQALAHGSLIQAVSVNRWRVLEPIRQFAEELLAQQGLLDAAKARHAAHCVAIAQAARDALLGPDAAEWMTHLEADHANVQATLQWALQTHQPEIALRIGQGIFRFWFRRGLWREGLSWLEQALALDEAQSATPLDILAKATRAAGALAHTLSQYGRAERHLQASLHLAYQLEDDEQVASAYCTLGILRKDQGQFDEALSYFDQSISFQSERGLKFPWQSKADTLLRMGRFDEAKSLFQKALALNQRIGDDEGLAHTLRGLAEIAWRNGDADAAESLLRQNEVICHQLNHARGLSWTAQQFGNVARTHGAWHIARKYYADALTQMQRMGDAWGLCEVMMECAHLAVCEHDYESAARWLGIAQAGWAAIGAKLTPYEHGLIKASLDESAQQLDAAVLQQILHQGPDDWATGQYPSHP